MARSYESYETIKFEKLEGYVLLTLNRPQSLNALNVKMWRELDDAQEWIDRDDDIRAFVVTGAPRPDGRPCFCAGADLKEMNTLLPEGSIPELGGEEKPKPAASQIRSFYHQRSPRGALVPTLENITWSPKISIAAIDGICTAGGTELAVACDIVICSETARISDMHVSNLGWIGGAAGSTNMAWRVGVSKAIELCCTGETIDGREAHRIGFANQVHAPGQYLEKAKEMGRKLGGMRLSALMMTKATCQAVQDMGRMASRRYCDEAFFVLTGEPDKGDWGPGRWVGKKK